MRKAGWNLESPFQNQERAFADFVNKINLDFSLSMVDIHCSITVKICSGKNENWSVHFENKERGRLFMDVGISELL